jgi:hypothetical protein
MCLVLHQLVAEAQDIQLFTGEWTFQQRLSIIREAISPELLKAAQQHHIDDTRQDWSTLSKIEKKVSNITHYALFILTWLSVVPMGV